MNVVVRTAKDSGRTIELSGDAQTRVQCVTRGFVAQERPTALGVEEDAMNVNGGNYVRAPLVQAWILRAMTTVESPGVWRTKSRTRNRGVRKLYNLS